MPNTPIGGGVFSSPFGGASGNALEVHPSGKLQGDGTLAALTKTFKKGVGAFVGEGTLAESPPVHGPALQLETGEHFLLESGAGILLLE